MSVDLANALMAANEVPLLFMRLLIHTVLVLLNQFNASSLLALSALLNNRLFGADLRDTYAHASQTFTISTFVSIDDPFAE